MKINNPWVGYTNRSFNAVKAGVITNLKNFVSEITDYTDSNLLMVIVNIFSGVAEMINYYIDRLAKEVFLGTAERYSSAIKIAKLINYRVRAAISPQVTLTFTAIDGDDLPVLVTDPGGLLIPAGTIVKDSNGLSWVTYNDKYILPNTSYVNVSARQRTQVSSQLGVSAGIPNEAFELPAGYEDETLEISLGSPTFTRVDTFAFSLPTSKHFTVERREDGLMYVVFGDGIKGMKLTLGDKVESTYYLTRGKTGNTTPIGEISTLESEITIPSQTNTISAISVTNKALPAGGTDIEGLEDIQKYAPLHLRTLDRAVTKQDYKDIGAMAPGVDKAAVQFNCGKIINLYVAPIGGGIASEGILGSVTEFVNKRRIIATKVEVKPAGETFIGFTLVATAKFRVSPTLVIADIKEALIQNYSPDNSAINKPVRYSDIIALVDNLDRVDYLSVHSLYAVPYARPMNHNIQLTWQREVLPGSETKNSWRILYSDGKYKLFKNLSYMGEIPLLTLVSFANLISIKIDEYMPGISEGYHWDFITYPYSRDIALDDYTVPRVDPSFVNISLTVNEQSYIND
jgi:hypothetical protein